MSNIEKAIEKKIGEVRIDTLDLSFGEIITLFSSNEFCISPDFQRYFRWSSEQRSRLIESVLLSLPIPQVFVVENQDGVLELIDGLQRISSIIQFIEPELISLSPLTLEGCDLVPELNGLGYTALPLSLRLSIKRSSVRAVVIKKQSTSLLRYAMFKRLNTGGSALSEQEVRNCTSRMIGSSGVEFYDFLSESAKSEEFKIVTTALPESIREQRGDEELVLRYLALKNGVELFRGSVRDWLDDYMEHVIFSPGQFDYSQESQDFSRLFGLLSRVMGEDAFVRFRGDRSIGGLAPAYFEAVTLGARKTIDQIEQVPPSTIRSKLIDTVQSAPFQANVGSGSNSRQKFYGRIAVIEEALRSVC